MTNQPKSLRINEFMTEHGLNATLKIQSDSGTVWNLFDAKGDHYVSAIETNGDPVWETDDGYSQLLSEIEAE